MPISSALENPPMVYLFGDMVQRTSCMMFHAISVANVLYVRWCRALSEGDQDWLQANKGLLRGAYPHRCVRVV